MTGNATFNIASVMGTGILEMNMGKDGFGMQLGMGGTNISVGTLMAAYGGYKEAAKVVDWKYGGEEKRSNLNATNMLGYTKTGKNQAVAKDIWEGRLAVTYGDTKGYGEYKVGGNSITLSKDLLGGGIEGSAKLLVYHR